MRGISLAAVLVLLAGCASSSGSAPKAGARRVLVEVTGVRTEADSFASRLLLEAEERGSGLVDARLSGAHLADLSDPNSEASRKLREAFPGDTYLGATVGPCQTFNRSTTMPGAIDPMTGVRTTEVIGGRDVACPVTLTELGPDGRTLRNVRVEGDVSITGGVDVNAEPTIEAARDAAERAAKKMWSGKK